MNKTALITGASGSLGLEFAKIFAEAEYNLVLVARSREKLEAFADAYSDTEMKLIVKDLSRPGAAKEAADEVHRSGIHIDVLINNAGFGLFGPFDELSLEKQTEMMQLNVISLTELTHCFLPGMRERNSGRILNVASTAAFQPGPLMAVYFATKAFVLSFSEALAEELSATNITVTALCPGPTKTNFGTVASVEKTKMFSHPMLAAQVAREGVEGLLKNKRVVITGSKNKAGAFAAKFLPRSTTAKVAKSITQG
ncbi:SDR family oxidoreductase [Domibacillus sp. PGB-M46]|uniref:SDR family NAD(P)-dependent oxidoreductase n=1 Tax=Domibacillus sp. PGB-M46 TaxID=2910255 RepID=UPI001F5A15CA|nr:SDR family oxidoreductase [Domibacillus sp. PGB-M46]MCI2254111.1 SDR family oxidoreductase [Domibacillus sp. PGB-M46]